MSSPSRSKTPEQRPLADRLRPGKLVKWSDKGEVLAESGPLGRMIRRVK